MTVKRRGKGRRRGGATQAQRLLAAERRTQAVELKLAGKSSPEIATILGMSIPGVNKAIRTAIALADDVTISEVEKLRKRQLEILKQLVRTFMPKALAAKNSETLTLLKVLEREAKLAGLDAPDKFEHAGPGGGPMKGVVVIPEHESEGDIEDNAPSEAAENDAPQPPRP